MKIVGWTCFLVWCVWITAVEGLLVHELPVGVLGRGLGALSPDLLVVLLLSCAARMTAGEARVAAILAALARSATSADSPFAIAAGAFLAVELHGYARRRFDVEGRAIGAVVAGTAAGANALWLAVSAALRSPLPVAGVHAPYDWFLGVAATTALVAYVLGPYARRLPGCHFVWSGREAWDRVAPVR
ncbi:MAG: hypothetical protein R3F34_08190 [Planctomycetota bacterium]